jgi:hypothetical protein
MAARGISAEEATTRIPDIVRDGMSGDGPRIRVNGNPPDQSWLLILRHYPPAGWGDLGCVVEIHRGDLERLLGAATGPPVPDSRPESPKESPKKSPAATTDHAAFMRAVEEELKRNDTAGIRQIYKKLGGRFGVTRKECEDAVMAVRGRQGRGAPKKSKNTASR